MSTISDLNALASTYGFEWGVLQSKPPEIEGGAGRPGTAQITFRVPFGVNTTRFIEVIAGLPTTVTIGGVSVTRMIPLQHPDFPSYFADNFRCKAFGGQADSGSSFWGSRTWSYSEIEVGFTAVPYAGGSTPGDGNTPFYTLNRTWESDYISMPANSFYFPSDGLKIKQDGGFHVAKTNYVLTIFKAPPVSDEFMNGINYNVNSTTFFGWPAGTVLFAGGSQSTTHGMAGVLESTLVYNLVYRVFPHNQLLRPNGEWEQVLDTYSGNPMYPSSDLNQLIA